MEEAAQEITGILYDSFKDSQTGDNNSVLVRFFKTHPFGDLPDELKGVVLKRFDENPKVDTHCLILLSTYGSMETWNRRQTSTGHQVIPLYSETFVKSIPMLSGLLSQFGVKLHDIVQNNKQKQPSNYGNTYNVFHIYDAKDNPLVPAQNEFVIPYGVKSVLGFGGELLNGELFAIIMFCRVHVSDNIAAMFKTLALSVQYAVAPFCNIVFCDDTETPVMLDRKTSQSKIDILKNLLSVTEEMALVTTAELDKMVDQRTEELKESYRIQGIINSILSLSLSPISLEAQLHKILELLLSVSRFAIEPIGCISIVEEEKDVLVMKAQINLDEHLLKACKRVPFNKCLCGIAASTRQIVFADCINHEHTTTYHGILQHGHYCVPIIAADESVLGVINLYLRHGHRRNQREEEFLSAIAKTIAGIVERKKMEDMLQKAKAELEDKVSQRTLDLLKTNEILHTEINKSKIAKKQLDHNYKIQQTINSILRISLSASSLGETLKNILELVVSIPWISLESKACIFLTNDEGNVLNMYSSINIYDEHSNVCEEVPFGQCLCGAAALTKEIVFSSGVRTDPRHKVVGKDVEEHGHYCVPIMYLERVIGVFTVFTREGHKREKDEEDILLAVTNTLAGIILRYKTEEILKEREEHLRSVIQTAMNAIISIDAESRIAFWNDGASNIFGYSAEEVIGKDISLIMPEYFRDAYHAGIKHYLATGQSKMIGVTSELVALNKAGVEFPIELSLTKWSARTGTFFTGIVRDITKRKNAILELEQSLIRLRGITGAVIQAMSVAVEARDPYTAGHQRRVADLARSIATEMGLSKDQIEGVRVAAEIHDLGKLSIPSEILSRAGKIKQNEFELIKDHSEIGYNILKGIDFPYPVADIVLQHHEKVNGSGYPNRLKGEEIRIEARIVCVSDVVEAISSHRPYRPALGMDKAIEEISTNSGILYDTNVVQACLKVFENGFTFKV